MAKLGKTQEEVLNQFEMRTDDWTYGTFENVIIAAMQRRGRNVNYQYAKSTISDAYKMGKWPNTVKRYILTNYALHGTPIGGMESVCHSFLSTMSDAEKKTFGIKIAE